MMRTCFPAQAEFCADFKVKILLWMFLDKTKEHKVTYSIPISKKSNYLPYHDIDDVDWSIDGAIYA